MNEANVKEASTNSKADADVKRGLDLPFFTTPGIINGITDQGMTRVKENYEKLKIASGEITDVLREAYSSNAKGARNMPPKSSSSPAPTPVPLSIFSATSWARSRYRKSCSSPSHTAARTSKQQPHKTGNFGRSPGRPRPRRPSQSRRVLPACCRRRPSSKSILRKPPESAGASAARHSRISRCALQPILPPPPPPPPPPLFFFFFFFFLS